MADEMENMANDVAADEDQISEDDWAAAMAEQAVTEPTSGQAAQPADIFPSFGGNAGSAGMMNELDMILDIPVQITVELGRTKITIKNLLQLAHGSVVELEAMAGETHGCHGQWHVDCPRGSSRGQRQIWYSFDRHHYAFRADEKTESLIISRSLH